MELLYENINTYEKVIARLKRNKVVFAAANISLFGENFQYAFRMVSQNGVATKWNLTQKGHGKNTTKLIITMENAENEETILSDCAFKSRVGIATFLLLFDHITSGMTNFEQKTSGKNTIRKWRLNT